MAVAEVIGLILLACAAVAFLVSRMAAARRLKRPRVSVDQARPEVMALAALGLDRDRIGAIKVLRERTGLGLREAHDTVTHWLQEDGRDRR
jgi:ribosomal protein L7/L12